MPFKNYTILLQCIPTRLFDLFLIDLSGTCCLQRPPNHVWRYRYMHGVQLYTGIYYS